MIQMFGKNIKALYPWPEGVNIIEKGFQCVEIASSLQKSIIFKHAPLFMFEISILVIETLKTLSIAKYCLRILDMV